MKTDKLTDLRGNRLLKNDFINTFGDMRFERTSTAGGVARFVKLNLLLAVGATLETTSGQMAPPKIEFRWHSKGGSTFGR
jgi:hypothetical protein